MHGKGMHVSGIKSELNLVGSKWDFWAPLWCCWHFVQVISTFLVHLTIVLCSQEADLELSKEVWQAHGVILIQTLGWLGSTLWEFWLLLFSCAHHENINLSGNSLSRKKWFHGVFSNLGIKLVFYFSTFLCPGWAVTALTHSRSGSWAHFGAVWALGEDSFLAFKMLKCSLNQQNLS